MKIKLSDIKIGVRQRLDMGDITDLADSMRRLGQIHSIGVHPDGLLIWGMRRHLAAKELGWTEIEATVREGLTEADAQEIELEEDIRRKDRTWQEESIALNKLFNLKARAARAKGERWTMNDMASYTGFGAGFVSQYVSTVGEALLTLPRDEELWSCPNFSKALDTLRDRQEKEAYAEMLRRRAAVPVLTQTEQQAIWQKALPPTGPGMASVIQTVNATLLKPLSLRERALSYNAAFEHLGPPNTPLYYSSKEGREFIHGFWFVGGGNISDFYGSYQIEYLKRITTLFPDIQGKQNIVHLFSGSIPISSEYTVVGLTDANNPPDLVADAEKLSSVLPFNPSLIYADPPYSIEDSEHYVNAMVNRERVISECAVVLKPGGFLVWIDQALPLFSNNELQFVGAIAYIRSTGNRFRVVSIFRKPLKTCPPTPTPSNPATPPTKSEFPTEFV